MAEALASELKVASSSGCVFCDLGLRPDEDGVHRDGQYAAACRLKWTHVRVSK